MCEDGEEACEEYRTQLAFTLLASVSAKVATDIDTYANDKGIDQFASSLLKQLEDEQALEIMERAFAPRVRNPSAYITRAAKTKLREEALKTWQRGVDAGELWGTTEK